MARKSWLRNTPAWKKTEKTVEYRSFSQIITLHNSRFKDLQPVRRNEISTLSSSPCLDSPPTRVLAFSGLIERTPKWFAFLLGLSARRPSKDVSPLLRLTTFSLLEPDVESWTRADSRALLKGWHKTIGQESPT